MKVIEHLGLSAAYALPFTLVGILVPLFTYVRRHRFSMKQKVVGVAITWAVVTLLVAVFGEAALGDIPLLLAALVSAYLVFVLLPARRSE